MKKVLFLGLLFGLMSVTRVCGAKDLSFSQSKIFIETDKVRVPFQVELAITPEQHMQGLMFRQVLPDNQGMLFLFPEEKVRYMWMKNTFVPLDMIFADKNGKIVSVVEGAQPFDKTIISSKERAAVVLEVYAGTVQRLGILPGHLITGEAFLSEVVQLP